MTKSKQPQPDRLERLASELEIKPGLVFGIDVGTSSCGWAVVNLDKRKIIAMGSRCFDAPEDPKTKTLYNAERRTKRGMRRTTYRRKGRMKAVRRLIRESGLWENPSPEYFRDLADGAPDPWCARANGVTESLEPEDAAAALVHLAKHRGFKSNAKRDTSDKEGGKVLTAAKEWDKKLGERTYAQTLVDDHPDRKRNRSGDYQFMPRRETLAEEARLIISRQRELGAAWATEEFEDSYVGLAFDQRPLQSSESLVGECALETGERRAARFSYSFELFRLLEKLVHGCRITTATGERPLTPEELEVATRDFGKQPGLTFKQLRARLNLSDDQKITAALTDEDLKRDVTKSASKASPGTSTLRKVVGETVWETLLETPVVLDRIAEIITFNEDDSEIRKRFAQLDLQPEIIDALMEGLVAGKFSKFKGTGHISAKAARKLIPEMLKGARYDEACTAVGYDHAAAQGVRIEEIKNPVVQRSLNQAVKQIEVLVREFGRPERIHVEMLRDVGKSADERGKMTRGLERRRKEREDSQTEYMDSAGVSSCSRDDVQMYELMKEQACRCPYCDAGITPNMIASSSVQVDHIYPRSRSHEDGFVNKVVTCVSCNQRKRNQTPWEWRGESEPGWWRTFESRVNSFNIKAEKRRRLLSKTFGDRELDFIERNKVDSSYVARALLARLQDLYPESYSQGAIIPGAERKVFARPGTMTPKMQRAWLGNRYKKNRDDDRHHAMDALTVAFLDEALYQKVARVYKGWEETGQQQHYTPSIDPPWEGFADDCLRAYDGDWIVRRTETRRVRGALHEETIRRRTTDQDGNEVYWQRKPVESITKSDLANIPDPVVRKAVETWMSAPKEDRPELPSMPAGKDGREVPVRKVRVRTKIATSNQINATDMGGNDPEQQGGFVSNSEMVRVDIYRVTERKADAGFNKTLTPGYYIVPVYKLDVFRTNRPTPMKAVVSGKPESDWPEMDQTDFVFSLFKDCYVHVTKADGESMCGYYRGADRSGNKILLSFHNERQSLERPGVKTLRKIRKFNVDPLGRTHEVQSEPWPGSQHN